MRPSDPDFHMVSDHVTEPFRLCRVFVEMTFGVDTPRGITLPGIHSDTRLASFDLCHVR
jgi:hypothetical protein